MQISLELNRRQILTLARFFLGEREEKVDEIMCNWLKNAKQFEQDILEQANKHILQPNYIRHVAILSPFQISGLCRILDTHIDKIGYKNYGL